MHDPTRPDSAELDEPIRADVIQVTQGGIETASADAIDIHQGGILRATAKDIAVSTGGVLLARADTVSLDRGVLGAAIGSETRVTQSYARLVGSGESTIDQSAVGALIGGRVTLRQPSAVGILIAGRVDGTVRPVLDWRGALALGAMIGLLVGILRR
jgi:hypothetical protein